MQKMKSNYSHFFCWMMFFLSAIFFFYEFILRISPGVMSNDLLRTFHINAETLGFMGSAFLQAYAWFQIPVGVFYDKYSTRKVISLACLICAVGTILFAATSLFWVAFIGRFIIGIGAAFGFVGALKVAEQWLPIKRFSFISGLLLTLGFLGGMVSDNLLAWVIKFRGWSTAMLYIGVFGIVLSIVMYCLIRDAKNLNRIQSKIKFHELIEGVFNIIKSPYMWINGLIGFCLYFPTSAFAELWGKAYLVNVLHLSSAQAVFSVTMVFLGWAVGAPVIGWLADLTQNRKIFFIIGALFAALFISIVLYVPHLHYVLVCILLFLFGFSSGSEVLNFPYARELSPQFSATAIATTNMIIVFGGAFSQTIIGWLLDRNGSKIIHNGVPLYSVNAYTHAFIVLPIVLLIAAVLSMFLRKIVVESAIDFSSSYKAASRELEVRS